MVDLLEEDNIDLRLDHFGLIAGFIGSKIVNKRGEGLVLDLVLGIVGAIAGGWLFNMFGASGVTGMNRRHRCPGGLSCDSTRGLTIAQQTGRRSRQAETISAVTSLDRIESDPRQ